MSKPLRDKDFIHLPEYPGGKTALQKFIQANLNYPEKALEKQVEGTVLVTFTVGFDGSVTGAKVLNGIGVGCDEEAVRVVKLLKFTVPKNRGVKVTNTRKIKINFKLPQIPVQENVPGMKITYQVTQNKAQIKKPASSPGYSYTITLG